jgi:hypothetical protein
MNQRTEDERRSAKRKFRVIKKWKSVIILISCKYIESTNRKWTLSSSIDQSSSSRTRCCLWRKISSPKKVKNLFYHFVVFPNNLLNSSQCNRLLDEQARRIRAEQNLQTFDSLNIDQLKDRLTRVERSNTQLTQLMQNFISREPVYRSTVYIPNFAV